jgi:hypothetical protein
MIAVIYLRPFHLLLALSYVIGKKAFGMLMVKDPLPDFLIIVKAQD